MSQRVTLDHPSLGGRGRQNTSRNNPQAHTRRMPVDSMMVNRAQQARTSQPRTNAHTKTAVTSRATARHAQVQQQAEQAATPEPTAEQYVEASERVLGNSEAYAEQTRMKGWGNSWKSHSVYGMAIMLFLIGMGVAFSGFVSTTKANEQIEVLGAVLDSGDEQAVRRLAESLPNEDEVTRADINKYQVAPEKPRYIRVPSIGVDTTRVLETGLTDDGAVDTPEGIYDTSWYNSSASVTDETGAMFVVGHYVGPSEAGVFYNLEDIKVGNIVEIEQGDGTLSHYRVIEKEEFPVDNVDMAKALNPVNPDKLGLNLMTCGGSWNAGEQQYDHRTLVRTEKI